MGQNRRPNLPSLPQDTSYAQYGTCLLQRLPPLQRRALKTVTQCGSFYRWVLMDRDYRFIFTTRHGFTSWGTKLWLLLPPGLLDRKIAEERMTTPGPTSKAPRRSSVASALQALQRIPPGSADAVRLVRELLVALRGSLNVGFQARGRRDEGDPLRRGGAQLCLQRGGRPCISPRWWHWT